MYISGNPVILWNKNQGGFYLKPVFVLIPKIKTLHTSLQLFDFPFSHSLISQFLQFPLMSLPQPNQVVPKIWRACVGAAVHMEHASPSHYLSPLIRGATRRVTAEAMARASTVQTSSSSVTRVLFRQLVQFLSHWFVSLISTIPL